MSFKEWVNQRLVALGTTGGRLCSHYGFSDSAFSKGVERACGPEKGHARAVYFMLAAEAAFRALSGEAAAACSSVNSRVPDAMTSRPGRNLSVAGLGVVSVSMNMVLTM